MGQVILIEDNQNLNNLLSVNLTTYVGAELIPRKNAADAIDLLKILPSIDIVITKDKIGNEDTAAILFEYLQEHQPDVGFIVLGKKPSGSEDTVIQIDDPKQWELVIKTAANMLGVTEKTLASKVNPQYLPIPSHYFLALSSSCCDVYIRIKKGPNEYQYIKRLHQSENYEMAIVNKYIDQGLKNFYIPQERQKEFANFISDQLVQALEDEQLEPTQKINVISKSYDIAVHEIKNLGFTSSTIQLAESIVGSMIKTFEKSPEMSPLLGKILNSKSGRAYQQAHMISIVASQTLRNISEKPNTLSHEKLAFAAFFHDITLTEQDELAKISNEDELKEANLDQTNYDLVFNHAFESASITRTHPEAPFGVDEIILQHHGSPIGKGFTPIYAEDFTTISQIFIISVHFANELLNYKLSGAKKPKPIIEELYKRHPTPKMTKVIAALEKSLKQK